MLFFLCVCPCFDRNLWMNLYLVLFIFQIFLFSHILFDEPWRRYLSNLAVGVQAHIFLFLDHTSHDDGYFLVAADIFLWRDKKVSAGVLGVATAIWVLFELLEYHLLTLVCHSLIIGLAVIFLWSNAATFINKYACWLTCKFIFHWIISTRISHFLVFHRSRPKIPNVVIPQDIVLAVASTLRIEINQALATLRDVASGRDLKKFLTVWFDILSSFLWI